MNKQIIDKDVGNYPEMRSLSGINNKLMVMLHGVGSDGQDLISLAPFFQTFLPDYYFIAPDGVEAYDSAPFGRQWFSLIDRTPAVIMNHVENNAPAVLNIIRQKQNQLNLRNKDTILLGFSQGTMMASYLTLIQDEPFAAMIGFSGRLIPAKQIKNTNTPICLIHGTMDDVVPAVESENFAKYCAQNHIEYMLKLVPNLRHSIDASGLEFAVNFLKNLK